MYANTFIVGFSRKRNELKYIYIKNRQILILQDATKNTVKWM